MQEIETENGDAVTDIVHRIDDRTTRELLILLIDEIRGLRNDISPFLKLAKSPKLKFFL